MIHEVFEQASTILRDLVLQNPSRPDYRLALAQCELGRREFRDLPINLGSPRGPESAAEAETLLRELVKENPREPRYRFELAKALVTRSGMLDELGPSEQESQLREAITITEELRASSSRLSAYQMLLAQAKHQLANVLKAQDRKPEAGILFEEALRILRGLTAESPTSAFHHVALAQMLVDWSSWQRGEGRVDDARQSLREALAITEKMAPAWGDNPMFQHVLSQLRAAVRAGE